MNLLRHTVDYITGCYDGPSLFRECKNCYARTEMQYYDGEKPRKKPFKPRVNRRAALKKMKYCFRLLTIWLSDRCDVFAPNVPDKMRDELFENIYRYNWHKYILVTKFPKNAKKYITKMEAKTDRKWCDLFFSLIMGVSFGCNETMDALLPVVREIPEFSILDARPLLESLNLAKILKDDFKFIMTGPEFGENPREFKPEWAKAIQELCLQNNIPFYFDPKNTYWVGLNAIFTEKDISIPAFMYPDESIKKNIDAAIIEVAEALDGLMIENKWHFQFSRQLLDMYTKDFILWSIKTIDSTYFPTEQKRQIAYLRSVLNNASLRYPSGLRRYRTLDTLKRGKELNVEAFRFNGLEQI